MAAPNILLVILDSVRARNTSLHEYGNRTTPFLEAFASEAQVYEQARAPSIHSVSSHASIFTGLHVPEHGVTKHESELDPTSTIWHELSAEHGYDTGMFSPNVVVTVSSNLAAPFETLDGPREDPGHRYFEDGISPSDIEGHQTKREYLRRCLESDAPLKSAVNGLYFQYYDGGGDGSEDESATTYIDSFLDWTAERDGPWGVCLNLMDAHYPYDPHPKHDKWGGDELQAVHDGLSAPPSRDIATSGDWWKLRAIESLYDGCIHQVDAAMEYLVSALRERNAFDDTLVVITSDHGEGFGEWSGIKPEIRIADHSWGLHEVQTHVPLVVKYPSQTAVTSEERLASLTQFPAVVRGVLEGGTPSFAVEEYAIATTRRLEQPKLVLPKQCSNRSQYSGPWRAVYTQDGVHVRKDADQGSNTQSLVIENAQVSYPASEPSSVDIDEMYDRFTDAGVKGTDQSDSELDDEVEKQLEELGYLR